MTLMMYKIPILYTYSPGLWTLEPWTITLHWAILCAFRTVLPVHLDMLAIRHFASFVLDLV